MSNSGRGHSRTKVIGYEVGYSSGKEPEIVKILEEALVAGIVTQFDTNANQAWFNGVPSQKLRGVRDNVYAIARKLK